MQKMGLKWTRVGARHGGAHEAPQAKHFAACVAGDVLYVHGGEARGSVTARLASLCLSCLTWSTVHHGTGPYARSHHRLCFVDADTPTRAAASSTHRCHCGKVAPLGWLIAVGGVDEARRRTSSVLVYDISHNAWTIAPSPGFPQGAGLSSFAMLVLADAMPSEDVRRVRFLLHGREGGLRQQRRSGNAFHLTGTFRSDRDAKRPGRGWTFEYSPAAAGADSRSGQSLIPLPVGGRDKSASKYASAASSSRTASTRRARGRPIFTLGGRDDRWCMAVLADVSFRVRAAICARASFCCCDAADDTLPGQGPVALNWAAIYAAATPMASRTGRVRGRAFHGVSTTSWCGCPCAPFVVFTGGLSFDGRAGAAAHPAPLPDVALAPIINSDGSSSPPVIGEWRTLKVQPVAHDGTPTAWHAHVQWHAYGTIFAFGGIDTRGQVARDVWMLTNTA